MVERPRQRHHPVAAHPSVGWLDAGRPATVTRDPDRASRVAAGAAETHAGGQRRRGATAGAAGDVVEIPGVVGGAVVRVRVGASGGELVHVQLAEQHRAGVAEPGDDGRVVLRHEVGQDLRASGGPDPGGVVQVLQRDRDPVQRPPVLPWLDLTLRPPRRRERRVRQHRDKRIDPPVQRRNPIQTSPRNLDRRHLPRSQPRPHGGNRSVRQLVATVRQRGG